MATPKLTTMELELERLKAENDRLKKASERKLTLKVSEKGGLSVYGMGRFPVTLYKEQWQKLADLMPQVLDFIKDNDGALKAKGE